MLPAWTSRWQLTCAVCHSGEVVGGMDAWTSTLCFGAVSQQHPARTRAGGKINLRFCFPGPIPEAVALEGERGRRAPWLGARALLGRATVPAPCRAQEEAVRAREPGFVSTKGCAAFWPPAPMDAVQEMLAQLDGGAGIRAGMRLWRRTGCRSLPRWERWEPASRQHRGDGPEGNLSVRFRTEVWFLSPHELLSSQRLISLQIRQALGFRGLPVGSNEPVAVPGQAWECFLQLSIPPLPPSPLPLQLSLLSLPSPRAGI